MSRRERQGVGVVSALARVQRGWSEKCMHEVLRFVSSEPLLSGSTLECPHNLASLDTLRAQIPTRRAAADECTDRRL